MSELPFRDLRMIDCASGLAGSVAAMVLGQLGADVVKIEPADGDPQRGTAAFAARNQGKRSIALDIGPNNAELADLLAGADVLIHEPGFPEALIAKAPHLVSSCIAPTPPELGEGDLPSDDFLVMARFGLLDEQPATNREGPAFVLLPFGSYCAGWLAAIGIAARLAGMMHGSPPGRMDTSLFQGALLPSMALWRDAGRPTEGLQGRIDKRVLPSIFECADGVWLHIMKNADETPLMKRLLADMGPETVAAENAKWPTHFRYHNWGANVRAFKSRRSAEWLKDLWASDIPVQPVLPMGELYRDGQAEANRYVVDLDDPDMGRIRVPGAPITITPPARAGMAASPLDGDRKAVLRPRSPATFPVRSRTPDTLPLAGVRVMDFGNYLAGPLSTMLLSDLGADVIKVEPPDGDPMRANESAFLGCQRGKRSIVIDLRRPEARPLIERLVRDVDIVHHNIRLPTARSFGLSYEDLRALNPLVVFGHVSAYGPEGPRRYWPGYDQLFQASAGWEQAHAGKGNRPAWLRFGMMDHMCAASLALGMLAAYYRRQRTGEGGQVAASLLGASIVTMSEVALRPDGKLTEWAGELDSGQTGPAPGRRLTKCADGWIAFSGPDANAPDPATLALLSYATAIARLHDEGFAAVRVPVQAGKAFLHDAANVLSGLVSVYDHPVYGELRHPGAFWNAGECRIRSRRAPPTLDQHRDEILSEIGVEQREIEELERAGVIAAPAKNEEVRI